MCVLKKGGRLVVEWRSGVERQHDGFVVLNKFVVLNRVVIVGFWEI